MGDIDVIPHIAVVFDNATPVELSAIVDQRHAVASNHHQNEVQFVLKLSVDVDEVDIQNES